MGLHVEEQEEDDDSPPASPPPFCLPTSPLPLTGEIIGGLNVKTEVEEASDQSETGSQKPFSFGVDFLLSKCSKYKVHRD